jgi:hypothetical protein
VKTDKESTVQRGALGGLVFPASDFWSRDENDYPPNLVLQSKGINMKGIELTFHKSVTSHRSYALPRLPSLSKMTSQTPRGNKYNFQT